MERLSVISNQLRGAQHQKSPSLVGSPMPDDVVICCAVRTPLTKAGKGALKATPPEEMLKVLFEDTVKRTGLDPRLVEDVCIGNVLQPGAGALSSRIGAILGNIPTTAAVMTVNRQCSSGLQAVANVVAAIRGGFIDIGIGGGVESMSMFDMMKTLQPENLSELVFEHPVASDCLIPMGLTSENVAEAFHISRDAQDAFSMESHKKAAAARNEGLYRDEIVPIKTISQDKNGILVTEDDGIRETVNVAQLGKLKPAFKKGGTTTAGNSSQMTDGAALILLARRSAAERHGLPIIGKFVSYAVVGVPPDIMGIGPMFAIPRALESAGLTMDNIDVFEVNEAFASQALLCAQQLGIPPHKLNPKGGAIALGHPLGATGARQIACLLPELRRKHGRFGIVSMCIGTGMGAAAVIEREITTGF
eukprot:Selendium_serpulae@DN6398_c0_g2_i1.p1